MQDFRGCPRVRQLVRASALLGTLICLSEEPAGAQVIRATAGPLVPYVEGDPPKRGTDTPGVRTVALYAAAFLGEAGQVEGLPSNAGTHFPTVHLLFSAAAFPKAGEDGEPLLRNLRRLNAHVRITPLDSAQREVTQRGALEILGTFPDTFALAQQTVGNDVEGAAFKATTRGLVPTLEKGAFLGARVGPLVARFAHIFQHPRGPTQVPYISDEHEFGWVWHQSPDHVIEGTHRAMATLEVLPQVRYLEVRIQLLGDWRSNGAWQREHVIVIDLGPGPSAQGP